MAGQSSSKEASARLLYSEPQLFASDLERALRFFVDKLGFDIAFRYGEPVHYAQVVRDGARLNLRHADRHPLQESKGAEEDILCATITVEGLETLFDELSERGANFHQPLRSENWGAQTFIIRDPDGNLICFAG